MKYNIIHFDEIDSTNKYIKENYNKLNEYTVVTTDYQSKGRGRENRVWESKRGDNLMLSMLLKPNLEPNRMPLISLIIGAAMQQVVNEYIPCFIKWPNDLIVKNKKICGILVEGVISSKVEAIIPGVGLNVNQEKFSDDLIIKATSLKKELGKDISKDILLNKFLDKFTYLYNDFLNDGSKYIKIVKKYNYLKDMEVYYDNKKIKVLDIMDNGNLLVKELSTNKEKELFFGEVTLKNIYK